jgi:uncharacterized protein YceK
MRRILIALTVCALLAGCGSSSTPKTAATTTTTTTVASPTAELEKAVRSAIKSNGELSNWVLWHNTVPSWATQSTSGPALAALRHAAAARSAQHLRMLGISPRFDVVAIVLAPSYLTATATVKEQGQVRPYQDGKPLRHVIKVDDVARLELRRAGAQFVVWKVEAA